MLCHHRWKTKASNDCSFVQTASTLEWTKKFCLNDGGPLIIDGTSSRVKCVKCVVKLNLTKNFGLVRVNMHQIHSNTQATTFIKRDSQVMNSRKQFPANPLLTRSLRRPGACSCRNRRRRGIPPEQHVRRRARFREHIHSTPHPLKPPHHLKLAHGRDGPRCLA